MIRVAGWLMVALMWGVTPAVAGDLHATTMWGDSLDDTRSSPEPWVGWTEGKAQTVWMPQSTVMSWGVTAHPQANQTLDTLLGKGAHFPAAPTQVRWAVLRCAFPGSPAYPLTTAQTQRLFTKPSVGLLDYFDRQSQGRTQMSLAWVEQVTLPLSQGGYWGQATSAPAFIMKATEDCLRQVATLRSLNDITGVAVFFNDVIDCCAYGGPYTLSLPGGETRRIPAVWLPPAAHTQPITIAHEMAHGLGLPHSNNADQDPDTTDNLWDLMSNIRLNRQVDPEIGPLPRSLHAYHRLEMGWLDAHQVTERQALAEPDRTEVLDIGFHQMVRIRHEGPLSTVITYRPAGHADDGERTEAAVFVDELDPLRAQPLWAMDTGLPLPNTASTDTSYFTVGERWTVRVEGREVVMEVLAVTDTGARIQLRFGPSATIFGNGFD